MYFKETQSGGMIRSSFDKWTLFIVYNFGHVSTKPGRNMRDIDKQVNREKVAKPTKKSSKTMNLLLVGKR